MNSKSIYSKLSKVKLGNCFDFKDQFTYTLLTTWCQTILHLVKIYNKSVIWVAKKLTLPFNF